MKRKQGWGIIGLKINQGSWNSDLNFLEKSENSFSDGYGENSAAFQVEPGSLFEWHRVSIYRESGKELMNKVVCMRLDNPCMGLHDHAQGPKTMPIASWTQMPKVWTCNLLWIGLCNKISTWIPQLNLNLHLFENTI
jgi:hypothetical protein